MDVFKFVFGRLAACLALAAVLTAVGISVAPAGVRADSSTELPTCWGHDWGVGPHFSWSTGQGGSASGYSYSPLGQVPFSPNGCEDINVTCGVSQCGDYRVRFYPSSGGNYANSWKSPPCGQSWCYVAAATDVQNGTWFRIEWRLFEGGQWGDHDFYMYV